MQPVATLPMYDWPEIGAATDRFWRAVRGQLTLRGFEVADHLARHRSADSVLRDPGLVFGQTCGLPMATHYRDQLQPILAPDYDVPGAGEGRYQSMIVTWKNSGIDSLAAARGACVAINDADSQSGHNALRLSLARTGLADPSFAAVIVTGGHRASMRAVARQQADLAAIDPVCLALAERHDPAVIRNLTVIGRSPSAPILPFVVPRNMIAERAALVALAVETVLDDPDLTPTMASLFLRGARRTCLAAYDEILQQKAEADAAGVPYFC